MRTTVYLSLASSICIIAALGQTAIDLRTQSRNVDFGKATSTRPVKVDTALPPVCSTGELFFLSTAKPGANLYACTATNAWALQTGGTPTWGSLGGTLADQTDLAAVLKGKASLDYTGKIQISELPDIQMIGRVTGDGSTIITTNPDGPTVTVGLNPLGVVLPQQDNNLSGQNKITVQRLTLTIANNASVGTVLYQLACNAKDGTAVNCPTTAVSADIIGIVVAGAGNAGAATISPFGTNIVCIFDGSTNAGDYVTVSGIHPGQCHATSEPPSIPIGWIQSSNGSGNGYPITLLLR